MQKLAKGWKDDQDTLPWLKTRAREDVNSDVRQAAVQELAQGWKDEPWLFDFLLDRAVNDPFEREYSFEDNPRQITLKIILKRYPAHPRTLALLKDRAKNDSDEEVRKYAKEVLENFREKTEK